MKKIVLPNVLLFFSFLLSYQCLAQIPTISQVQPQGGGASINSACKGQTVRIVGTDFQPQDLANRKFIFNSATQLTYSFIDANTIEVVIPLLALNSGIGITYSNSFGTSTAFPIILSEPLNFNTQPLSSVNICEGTPLALSGSITGGGTVTYLWEKNSTPTSFVTSNLDIATTTMSDAGFYRLKVTSITCGNFIYSINSNVTITPTPSPSDASLSSGINKLNNCENGTFTLDANVPAVGSGLWTCISGCGGISIVTTNSPTSQVTGVPNTAVPTRLQWSISNSPCPNSNSTVDLINWSMPTSVATVTSTTHNICMSSPSTALSGNTPGGTFTNVDWLKTSGPPTFNFSSPTTASTNFSVSAAGSYILNYIIRNGACNSISPDVTVTAYNSPVVSAGTNITACYGVTSMISGSAMNATVFNWTKSGGNGTLVNTGTLNPSYTSSGVDSLGTSFQVTLSASNPGCTSVTSQATLTIRSLSRAVISLGFPISVCSGSTAAIPIQLIGASPYTGLGIFDGTTNTDLGTISGTLYNYTFIPTASKNYTLAPFSAPKDNNNCAISWSGNRQVNVNASPSATISSSSSTICPGGSTSITLNASNGGGGWTLYVNENGGPNTAVAMPSPTFSFFTSPSATTTYTIDSIQTSSCGKIKLININTTVTVLTNPNTGGTVTMSLSEDTLCFGQTTTLTINNIQASTVYKLIKNFSSTAVDSVIIGATPGSSSISIVLPYSKFTPGTKDTIRFLARRSGCGALFPSVSRTFVYTSALTPPLIDVVSTTATCNKKILQLQTPTPLTTYQWYLDGTILVNNNNLRDTAYAEGSYTLQAKDNFKCQFTSTATIVSYNADKPIITSTDISSLYTKLDVTSTPSGALQWYVFTTSGIKKIQGETSSSLNAYYDGQYLVAVQNSTCINFSAPLDVTGKIGGNLLRQGFVENDSAIVITARDFADEMVVYPNPIADNDISIDYLAGLVSSLSITMYSADGNLVYQKSLESGGYIRHTIPAKNLTPGVYTIFISNGIKQSRKNIIIL